MQLLTIQRRVRIYTLSTTEKKGFRYVNWTELAQWQCKTSSRNSEALVGIILIGYSVPYAIIPRSVTIIQVWLRVSTAPEDHLPISGL